MDKLKQHLKIWWAYYIAVFMLGLFIWFMVWCANLPPKTL